MKTWNNIKWKINWWMYHRSPLYINLNIFKCYDEWRPWKKYFKKPSWRRWGHWKTGFNILRIECEDLWWKLKYGEPRHEEDPTLTISFLWWTWRWTLGCPDGIDSMIYWETVLWMNILDKKYENKAEVVYQAIRENTWSSRDKKETAYDMLTPSAQHLYNTWSHHIKAQASSPATN